jgi:hypothetical protein
MSRDAAPHDESGERRTREDVKVLRGILIAFALFAGVAGYFGYIVLGMLALLHPAPVPSLSSQRSLSRPWQ